MRASCCCHLTGHHGGGDINGSGDPLETAIARHVPLGVEVAHIEDDEGNDVTYTVGRWARSVELPQEALDFCTALAAWKSGQGPAPRPQPLVTEIEVPEADDLKEAATR